jgi:type IX secretion system PorP/SprF family membrane protein
MIKKPLILLGMIFCTLLAKAQQGAQFSQYIFNGLYINPAYSGYKEDFYVNSFYSSQWTGVEGAPQTQSIAADGAVNNGKVGLGLIFQHDQVGAQNNIAAYGNYAYRIQLNDEATSKLAFGLGFGFIQSGIDGSKLNSVQSNDSFIPVGYESVLLPDARFGILYTNESFFIGASVDNILANYLHKASSSTFLVPIPKPNEYLTIGALFDLNDDTKFKPSVLIKNNPGLPESMDINAYILLGGKVWMGATYRTNVTINNSTSLGGLQNSNAMVAMTEFNVSEALRIGYAFDYSLNKIGNNGYGSHLLSVSFLLKKSNRVNPANQSYF